MYRSLYDIIWKSNIFSAIENITKQIYFKIFSHKLEAKDNCILLPFHIQNCFKKCSFQINLFIFQENNVGQLSWILIQEKLESKALLKKLPKLKLNINLFSLKKIKKAKIFVRNSNANIHVRLVKSI